MGKTLLICITVIFFLASKTTFAQQFTISGVITNQLDNKPIINAKVYINQSQINTTTDVKGFYIIVIPNIDVVELIVSAKDFDKAVKVYKKPAASIVANIVLSPLNKAEEDIIVTAAIKDGWKKWGVFFMRQFLGETPNAEKCSLKNTKAVKFRMNGDRTILSAYAFEPLEVTNKVLGYNILYDLVKFEYHFNTGYFVMLGYTQYYDVSTTKSKRKINKYAIERKLAYEGSILHFMKSLYNNTMAANNFYVVRSYLVEDTTTPKSNGVVVFKQTTAINFKRNKKYKEVLGKTQLTLDSILLQKEINEDGDSLQRIGFKDRIFVMYQKEMECDAFAQQKMRRPEMQKTRIYFMNDKEYFLLNKQGDYFGLEDIILDGYMGFERIAEQLPIDYEIP